MEKAPKKPKREGLLRHVLAANLKRELARQYPGEKLTNAEKKLAASAGVGHGTVQRIRKADVGPSLDSIEFIAEALHTSVTALLTPSEATLRALNASGTPKVRPIRHRSGM